MNLSAFVGMLPFLEQQPLWEKISNPLVEQVGGTDYRYPAMGANPVAEFDYSPWMTEIASLRCPSDPGVGLPAQGRTNYAVCMGDSIHGIQEAGPFGEAPQADGTLRRNWWHEDPLLATSRGAFITRYVTKFADFEDGQSNTIMAGEILTSLGDRDTRAQPATALDWMYQEGTPSFKTNSHERFISPTRPRFWSDGTDGGTAPNLITNLGRGFSWASKAPTHTVCWTSLGPNKATCVTDIEFSEGVLPPSSQHPGGVHVLMGDGAVKFITDSIEAGNANHGSVGYGWAGTWYYNVLKGSSKPGAESPFGLWGALGTKAGKEVLSGEF